MKILGILIIVYLIYKLVKACAPPAWPTDREAKKLLVFDDDKLNN